MREPKMRSAARCAWVLVSLSVGRPEVLPGEGGAAEEPKEPEFSKEESREAFELGRSLFGIGKFEEAAAQFKKVRGDAKAKADQLVVQSWIDGAAGGILLKKLKKVPPANWLALYDQVLQDYYPKYRATAAGPLFKEFLSELEEACFVILETFDVPSLAYSEKFGKTFVSDPKQTLDGTRCLRWTNTKDRKAAALKIQGATAPFPSDWTPFSQVEFWVSVRVQPRGAEAVIMCSAPGGGGGAKAKAAAREDFFQRTIEIASSPGKWKRIRVPISDFRPSGGARLDAIAFFQIQIPAGAAFDFLIDRVALVRKEPLAPGAKNVPGVR